MTSMATEKMADLKEGGEPTIPIHIETGSPSGTTQVHSNAAHRGTTAALPRGGGWGATPAPSNRRSSHGSHH